MGPIKQLSILDQCDAIHCLARLDRDRELCTMSMMLSLWKDCCKKHQINHYLQFPSSVISMIHINLPKYGPV